MRKDWDDIQKQIEDKVGSAISTGIHRLEQALLN